MIKMLDLERMHDGITDELVNAFWGSLLDSSFIGGKPVEKFEKELAEYLEVGHAIGVSSGTDALLVSMMAMGVKPGDEVITTPYTFFATAGSIARLGAKPVFVDIQYGTFNIDPAKIEEAITDKTVGIIPVHLFGQCADMDSIVTIAREHGIWVLEDAAQAIGADYFGSSSECFGKTAGTMGDAGTFSFFPSKNLGALGDGGAVVTNDSILADKIRLMRSHGSSNKYNHSVIGGNFRLDAIQTAFLSVKLPNLDNMVASRRAIADRYDDELSDGYKVPMRTAASMHVFNQYVIRERDRGGLKERLKEKSIESAIYYPLPLHLQECFEYLGYKEGDFPVSEQASKEALAIPIDPCLTVDEIDEVVDALMDFAQE